MNKVKIEEWGHYKIQEWTWNFTHNLYLIKLRKIKVWFFNREVDWIVYSEFECKSSEQVMPLSKFKSIVLYKVN